MSTKAIETLIQEGLKSPWGSDVRLAHEAARELRMLRQACAAAHGDMTDEELGRSLAAGGRLVLRAIGKEAP